MIRGLVAFTFALALVPSVCIAQPARSGTFQISGVTGVVANRQTISTLDADGRLQSADVGLTSANAGLEVSYYLTPRFSIGALVAYQRLTLDAPDRNARFEAAGGYFGPMAQVRLPLGNKSEFVFVGSDGGVVTRLVNQNTGLAENVSTHVNGRYWLVGGGLSFLVLQNATLDLGLRYQSSTFSGRTSQDNHANAAGLLVSAAFSLYIH
jgi:long-subunit fatty acid transport protein